MQNVLCVFNLATLFPILRLNSNLYALAYTIISDNFKKMRTKVSYIALTLKPLKSELHTHQLMRTQIEANF
ncbi:hypothetical protein PFLA_b0314 [Pseudoalteromonas flavipulchra NCIMB 2033 = ATCC BAA-314]|nr:hypothetical protein [Pseudoalteromonas flavipulchra NCIMB 2033 = ATCC BAA-314]